LCDYVLAIALFGWLWLVLIYYERKVVLARWWLVAGADLV